MIDYEGFKKVGKFTLESGVEVFGELSLKGRESSLDLYSELPFELHDHTDILGVFYNGGKVSLIKCIGILRSGKSCTQASLFPHFVLLSKGKEHIHIRYADQVIDKMSFTVDDSHMLFYDTSTFGHIFVDTRAKLERLLEEEKPEKKIELGSNPSIFY